MATSSGTSDEEIIPPVPTVPTTATTTLLIQSTPPLTPPINQRLPLFQVGTSMLPLNLFNKFLLVNNNLKRIRLQYTEQANN